MPVNFKSQAVIHDILISEPPVQKLIAKLVSEPYNYIITCGKRSVAMNRVVGGKPYSRHLDGMAFDVRKNLVAAALSRLEELAALAGYEVIEESDHYHVQPKHGSKEYPFNPARIIE